MYWELVRSSSGNVSTFTDSRIVTINMCTLYSIEKDLPRQRILTFPTENALDIIRFYHDLTLWTFYQLFTSLDLTLMIKIPENSSFPRHSKVACK